ncbi:TA system VapC family ribonuclease toxin [Edaphobacter modestus]|uniref:TA system VapC family ribonuclease toxin n=1 Tax=Edaphobacter modestus TaxID=388466 RepID=UPI0013EE4CFF|nr:TA system VapC family ribonuclease toxin [Edaphobacter modestus]
MTKAPIHLLDVNGLIALLNESHVHNAAMTDWFATTGLQWALCPFTEAGLLRFMTRPKTGDMSMEEANAMLARLKEHPGYHFQPITDDWHTLTASFSKRLHGHNQITDAYLLGMAISKGLILATFDQAILHLAGEHRRHVLMLKA